MYKATFVSLHHSPAVYKDGYSKSEVPNVKASTILALEVEGNGIASFEVNEPLKKLCGYRKFTSKYLSLLTEALKGKEFLLHNDMSLVVTDFNQNIESAVADVIFKLHNK